MGEITRIVLTGGPCSGKTSALMRIPQQLRDHGFGVLAVSETATELFLAGVKKQLPHVDWLDFQEHIMRLQIAKEEQYVSLLMRFTNKRKVLLCDRGCRDGKAYVEEREYTAITERLQREGIFIDDNRYDMVCHLVSAAYGAEEYYNLDNEARIEKTIEEAREQDRRTMDVWRGHPCHIIIDNGTDFESKMRRLWVAICDKVGIP